MSHWTMVYYWTLLVPYVERGATQWHPTEKTGPFAVLNRGAFSSAAKAHEWAREHLGGAPYSVHVYPSFQETKGG